jgi:hypothetical protein
MPNPFDPCANCNNVWGRHFTLRNTSNGVGGEWACPHFDPLANRMVPSTTSKFSAIVSPAAKTIPPAQFNYADKCGNCGATWSTHYINSTPNLSCAPNGNQYFVLAAQTKPSNTQPGDMFGNPCADDFYARDDISTRKRIAKAIDTAKAMNDNQPAINDHTCPTCKNTRVSKCERACWKCGGVL